MRPNFALNLSFDKIELLHRAKGGWRSVGDTALDDPDMTGALAYLRQTAMELAGGQFATKLIIPNSQILFRDVMAAGDTPGARRVAIRQALDGTTPYRLEDLVFDWSDAGGGMAKVAVLAAVTLQEAEAFAVTHRFNPVAFVAKPQDGDFDGEPWFGTTRFSTGLLSQGETVERDDEPVVIIGPLVVAPPRESSDPEADADEAQVAGDTEPAVDEDPEPPQAPAKDDGPKQDAPKDPPPLEQDAIAAPDQDTTDGAITFATRRSTAAPGPADTTPLSFEGIVSRMAITAETVQTDALPPLGNGLRSAEVTHLSVTAPDTAADDRAAATVAVPASVRKPTAGDPAAWIRARALEKARVTIPPAPATPKLKPPAVELTVFGARKPGQVRGKPRYLGLILTLALVLALVAAALISNLILGDTALSRLLRPGDPAETALAIDSQAVGVAEPDQPTEAASTPAPEEITPELAAQIHAATGIWPLSPVATIDTDNDGLDDLYIASIDPGVVAHDAVALPGAEAALSDAPPDIMQPPAPAGTVYELDENGFVRALPEGALTPEGAIVFAGKPVKVPAPRPGEAAAADPEQTPDRLAGFRPRPRPGDLVESNEKARLGGRTLSQLAAIRPAPRPASAQETEAAPDAPPTKLAVLKSPKPAARPSGFSRVVEQAIAEAQASIPGPEPEEQADEAEVAVAVVAPARLPATPTRANVAQEATVKNAIPLGKINLIGVYGSSSDRRALIRLSSGKYVKVRVGDRVDGGQVAAIGSSEVLYVKGGRKVTLAMPKG